MRLKLERNRWSHCVSLGILLLTSCMAAKAGVAVSDERDCVVVAISDGDTLTARCGKEGGFTQLKVRLAGIDAPERGQAFGARAREALAGLTFGRPVDLHCRKTDRYGRRVCQVMVAPASKPDGPATVDAGLALLSVGLAWWYRDYAREQSVEEVARYASAEEEAKRRRVGLWRDVDPVAPWQWRRQGLPRRPAAGPVTEHGTSVTLVDRTVG